MDTVIKTENLKFSYIDEETGRETPILKGIDFSVRKGEFVAVLGHNGSGKSTLAKHLNAINIPTSGKVNVCGMDTADEKLLYSIRQKVAISQSEKIVFLCDGTKFNLSAPFNLIHVRSVDYLITNDLNASQYLGENEKDKILII